MQYRVVVVDDTEDIRYLVKLSLKLSNMFDVVGEAGDGAVAVDVVAETLPDAVVLDIAMPVMDGLQALPEIKRVSPHTKVMMLTGFNVGHVAENVRELGADGYLEKGATPKQICDTLLEIVAPGAEGSDLPPSSSAASSTELSDESQLSELLAVVSHELLNPLTAIKGFAETLQHRRGQMSETEIGTSVGFISGSATHMHELLTAFADARRIEIQTVDLRRENLDLGAIALDVAREFITIYPNRDVRVDIHGDVNAFVDRTRVRQIITNLVSNALKFSDDTEPVAIDIRGYAELAEVDVTDKGDGIPTERRDELFHKFSRLGADEAGTGLGLYVSRGLARSHGGELELRDSGPTGSRFTLSLPRQ